jgi:hypothetical protein
VEMGFKDDELRSRSARRELADRRAKEIKAYSFRNEV